MIEFEGAKIVYHDDPEEREYEKRGKITLMRNKIIGFYDHTILLDGDHKMRVMETYEEILEKLS